METAPRNCRFLSLVVVELVLTFLEAAKPTQNPEIPKKHRVYTNFFEEFARTFALFPVTRVRNPTEIVQMNLFT